MIVCFIYWRNGLVLAITLWWLKVSCEMGSSLRNHLSCKPFQIFSLLHVRSPVKSRSAICESIAVLFQGIKCSVNKNKYCTKGRQLWIMVPSTDIMHCHFSSAVKWLMLSFMLLMLCLIVSNLDDTWLLREPYLQVSWLLFPCSDYYHGIFSSGTEIQTPESKFQRAQADCVLT